jgi:hypothetical protein
VVASTRAINILADLRVRPYSSYSASSFFSLTKAFREARFAPLATISAAFNPKLIPVVTLLIA